MIPDEVIEQVKSRAEILEVVGEVVRLKRAGASYKGLCPFHGEKTPSFVVNPQQGTYHCFGCQEHGDSLKFIRETQHLSFPEAIRALAARVGIEVPDSRPMSPRQRRAVVQKRALEDRLFDAQEKLTQWYELALTRSDLVQSYLISRQISPEAAREFRLGWAPNDVGALTRWMEQVEVPLAELEQLGVVIPFDPEQPHRRGDARLNGGRLRFRDRLMCPIFDTRDRVVGFSGRVVDPKQKIAKYLNSPETPIFTKGDHVFGLKSARVAMTRSQHSDLILCEGNLDVVALWQAGIPNSVAAMGTAVTEQQTVTIKRLTRSVICVMDGDAAGQKAAFKSLPTLLSRGLDVRGKLLPEGQDPDSFIKQHGGASFQSWLSDAPPLLLVQLEALAEKHPRDPIGQAAVLRDLIPLVALVESEHQRPLFLDVIAKRLEIERSYLTELLLNAIRERAERGHADARGFDNSRGFKGSRANTQGRGPATHDVTSQSSDRTQGHSSQGHTQGHSSQGHSSQGHSSQGHSSQGSPDLPPDFFDDSELPPDAYSDTYSDSSAQFESDSRQANYNQSKSGRSKGNRSKNSRSQNGTYARGGYRDGGRRGRDRYPDDADEGRPWWTQVKLERGPGRVYPRRFGERPTGEAEIQLAPTPQPPAHLSAQPTHSNALRGYERETISFLFYHPELLTRFLESGGAELFDEHGIQEFLLSLKSERDRGLFVTGELYFERSQNITLVASLRDCIASPPPMMERVKPERKLDDLMRRLKRSQLQLRLTRITSELKQASEMLRGDRTHLSDEERSTFESKRAELLERYQSAQTLISELSRAPRSLSS